MMFSILHEKKWSELVYFSKSGTAIVIPNEGAFVDQVCSHRYNQSSIQAFNKQMNVSHTYNQPPSFTAGFRAVGLPGRIVFVRRPTR